MKNILFALLLLPTILACNSSTTKYESGDFIMKKTSVYFEGYVQDAELGEIPARGSKVYLFKDVDITLNKLDYSIEGKLKDKNTGEEFDLIESKIQKGKYIEFENIPTGTYTFVIYYKRDEAYFVNATTLNTNSSNHVKHRVTIPPL